MKTATSMRRNRVLIALTAAVLGAMGSSRMAKAENLQGFAKGFIFRPISLTNNGAPLLQSFYFRFTDDDHHYKAMGVEPGVDAINKVTLGFADHNSDDQYFYNITLAPYFGQIFRGANTEFARGGRVTFPVKAPLNRSDFVFVVRGFNLQYRLDDHHLEEIGIQENNGLVTVALNDDNDDDPIRVDLQYAYIPRTRFSEISGRAGRNVKGGQRTSISAGTGVIRGFNMKFKNGDHHIKEIGVMMNGAGRLEVYYGDKNQDDPFDWNVAYGILKP